MIGRQRSSVFLSYARTDGEAFAATLRERLRDNAPDIEVKQDRNLLEGGVGWWKQLTEAIDSVEFLVLVMTPSSMQSEMVRKEWRYARQTGRMRVSRQGRSLIPTFSSRTCLGG